MTLTGICILRELLTNFSFNVNLRNDNSLASTEVATKPGHSRLIPRTPTVEGGKPVDH